MNAAGIDVSSRKSTVAVLRPFGEVVCLPFDVAHNAQGLACHIGGSAASGHGFYRTARKQLTLSTTYFSSQHSVVAFLCYPFDLPATCKIFFCQVLFVA